MKVEVKNLQKHFGKTRAVENLSFSFTSGQVFGFVGPNGAGKTTTMRILATLDEPTAGNAYVDGISVIERPEQVRRMIGFVPDSLPTHREMCVYEYLDFFARAYRIKGKKRRQVLAGIEEFTRLSGIREKLLNTLSKGMKQRVNLARALVHDPPVLIMDEPAAGLDPRARVELRELLKILANQGKSILISSHILTELAELCNGAVIIEQGKLLTAGTMEQLLSGNNGSERRLVRVRSLDRREELYQEILQLPQVERASVVANEIEVELNGNEEVCCDVLRKLVEAGHRIVEFKGRRADLEQIFMDVTKGEVQ